MFQTCTCKDISTSDINLDCPIHGVFIKPTLTFTPCMECVRLRTELAKSTRRAAVWKRMSKILYSEMKIMTFEIKEMTKRLKRALG